MNNESDFRARAERMAEVSRKVRNESMRVNAEFARIEQDPEAARSRPSDAVIRGISSRR